MDFVQKESKETEFNSSVATLMRIDQLIRELHSLRRGIIPKDKFGTPVKIGNTTELYILTLEDLHIEIAPKMTAQEFIDSETNLAIISKCKERWGTNLNVQYIEKCMPRRTFTNIQYTKAWIELKDLGDNYFLLLVKIADIHGMLLINKKLEEDAPQEWDEGPEENE